VTDSTFTGPEDLEAQSRRSPFSGRGARWVLGAGLVLVVIGGVVLLRAGGGKAVRAFPEAGEVVEAFDARALKVSSIDDFVIAEDDTMVVVVGDSEGDRSLVSVSPSGRVSTLLRSSGKDAVTAQAVALGREGEIYVADGDGHVVSRSKNGKIRRVGSFARQPNAADTDPGLDSVRFMAVDPTNGDIYLADLSKIDRLDSKGQLSTVAGAWRAYGDKSPFPPDTVVPDPAAPATAPAKAMRSVFLQGIAFDPDSGSLYAQTGHALVRIGRDGMAQVIQSDVGFRSNVVYDPARKNLYVGAESGARDGIARISSQGDVLVLSGTEGATHIADRIGTDSRNNVYWLHDASDSIDVAGNALSEIRVDLQSERPKAIPKSPASGGRVEELFDLATVVRTVAPDVELRGEIGPLAAGRDGTVYFAINGDTKPDKDDRLIAVPRSGKPEILLEETLTTALSVSDDGTLYAAQRTQHHGLYFRRPGGDWHRIVDYKPQYGQQSDGGVGLQWEASSIAIDEQSKDIFLSDTRQINRVDRQGRLTKVAGAARADGEPLPGFPADGTPAAEARFGFVADLAVDPASHDLYINMLQLFRITPDGVIRSVKDPNGQPLAVGYGGLAFDTGRSLLIHRDPLKELTVGYVSADGRRSPIPAADGQVGRNTVAATSDSGLYIWNREGGKVRYLGPTKI
jgi:hypothetical protein